MSTSQRIAVKSLALDLHNYRTVTQLDETGSVRAMIAIHPSWFWELAESLLTDGYDFLENIVVLQTVSEAIIVDESGKKKVLPPEPVLMVKEGNRRVAVLKIALGYIDNKALTIPEHIKKMIAALTLQWKARNRTVPCLVFSADEAADVKRIVARVHARGERAGRDKWNAVARTRHDREEEGIIQPSLDLLENYLKHGENLNLRQKEEWSGDYPLTIVDELLKRAASRFGASSARDLAAKYPEVIHRAQLDDVLLGIGLRQLETRDLRKKEDDILSRVYGLPPLVSEKPDASSDGEDQEDADGGDTATTTSGKKTKKSKSKKSKALPLEDPRAVKQRLKDFEPRGRGREKLATLLKEAQVIDITFNRIAFCLLLRCMFELSAKAYCKEHQATGGPTITKADGNDKDLVGVLREIYDHITEKGKNKATVKQLHGAIADLGKSDKYLSITSLNQLVHNPSFTVTVDQVCIHFANIFPLLEAMN